MGKLKNYYFDEINEQDESVEPNGYDEPDVDEQQEQQDFAQDGEFENMEQEDRL